MIRSRIGIVVHSIWAKSGPGIQETRVIEYKDDRKAGKCLGLDGSFIVAKTLVAVIKSFDPTIAS
jgi:hypothetical protein